MSKRSGDLVLLADVVEEVGADATRFMLLYRRNDAAMDFDFAAGQGTDPRQPGVLRAVRPRPHLLGVPHGGARTAGARSVARPRSPAPISSC